MGGNKMNKPVTIGMSLKDGWSQPGEKPGMEKGTPPAEAAAVFTSPVENQPD